MLRLVLGVALAAAILGAVAPALEDARASRTDRLTARELDRVESAAESLVREDDPGARRTLELSLPDGSPTAAPLAFVALGGVPNDEDVPDHRNEKATDTADGDVLAYRVAGGPLDVRRIDADLRAVRDGTRLESDSRALVLRDGGTYRLTLRLLRTGGRLTVAVAVRAPPARTTAPALSRAKPPPNRNDVRLSTAPRDRSVRGRPATAIAGHLARPTRSGVESGRPSPNRLRPRSANRRA